MLRGLPPLPSAAARHRGLRATVVALALLTGCTVGEPVPDPGLDGAAAAAAVLAQGLARKDVAAVPFSGVTGAEANTQLQALVSGLGPVSPAVAVVGVQGSGDTANAQLRYTWTFPGVPRTWGYDTSATLVREAGSWRTRWRPVLVEPSLDAGSRLAQRRLPPGRGEVLGAGGDPLVTLRPVERIGIDKSRVATARAARSARRLGRLVGVDPDAYAARVAAAGREAFVEAITLRAGAADLPDEADVHAIPGAVTLKDRQMLAPTRTFARPLLGTVGEATKEAVDASRGAVVAGDQVGLSGLQQRYDTRLRGTPGVQVVRTAAGGAGSTSPSPASAPPASPASSTVLFRVDATDGTALRTTLDLGLQRLAERTLARTRPASALVAIRPSSGAVVAAASGPGADDQAVATVGRYPPGSTFKVASSLALLRAGLRPGSPVSCPATRVVDGRRFTNYSDYPRRRLGRITLEQALANSCNTAFIGERGELGEGDLAAAAASLGLGTDYDVGFASFFGSVPQPGSETERAAAMIGQGRDEASPLAMAAVAASVAAGRTVVPQLVEGHRAAPRATPLTADEARQLRQMMRAVVTSGSAARALGGVDGPPVLAKTGTAEYGEEEPPRTHAWMIAAQGDLAVAVFVADGRSGSATAGPLLARFLEGAR